MGDGACRLKLFTSENLLEHEPQQHQIAARKVNILFHDIHKKRIDIFVVVLIEI